MVSDTNTEGGALMLRTPDGGYWAIPAAELERYRVPAEREAEVAALFPDGGDVQGFVLPGLIIGFFAGIGAGVGGYEVGKGIGGALQGPPTPKAADLSGIRPSPE